MYINYIQLLHYCQCVAVWYCRAKFLSPDDVVSYGSTGRVSFIMGDTPKSGIINSIHT